VFDGVKKIVRDEGLSGLYAGLPAAMMSSSSTNFAYFYWYNWIRNSYRRVYGHIISTPMEFVIGAAAGALAQIFTIPVTVVVTRQQTSSREERRSLKETWWKIVREEGWTALWKGLGPALVLVVNPAITYGCTERLKHMWKVSKRKDALSAFEMFVIGALAKMLATVVTYPYIIAKVRMQYKPSEKTDKKHVQYKHAWDVIGRTVATDGFFGLFRVS
jgi:TRAP-type C4-dicarboxylate transport system permease large subunit